MEIFSGKVWIFFLFLTKTQTEAVLAEYPQSMFGAKITTIVIPYIPHFCVKMEYKGV